jgi:hypothetical protein
MVFIILFLINAIYITKFLFKYKYFHTFIIALIGVNNFEGHPFDELEDAKCKRYTNTSSSNVTSSNKSTAPVTSSNKSTAPGISVKSNLIRPTQSPTPTVKPRELTFVPRRGIAPSTNGRSSTA